jgi:hypothetical protein
MSSTKCVGPAHSGEDDSEARRDLLGGSSSNTPSLDRPQAPPDDRGESDFDFFRRHPDARTRNRLPFEGEFSAADLAEAGGRACYVRAIAKRIPGRPLQRARWLLFVQGGSA